MSFDVYFQGFAAGVASGLEDLALASRLVDGTALDGDAVADIRLHRDHLLAPPCWGVRPIASPQVTIL